MLPALEHADVTGDHLLLIVGGDAQRVVADREAADGHLLANLQQRLLLALEALAGEAEEHQDDADVNDVAAVAPLRAADEADERGEDVGARRLPPDLRAADELLRDRRRDEGAEREAEPELQTRTPSA